MKNLKINYALLFAFTFLIFTSCGEDDPASSCNDGIKNGIETGVDCGGDCAECATCSDGVQNGNETGVDCGGDCDECATCSDGVQNGNETGVDCGGDCDECLIPTEHILGAWRVLEFDFDGEDILSLFNIDDIIYEFKIGGVYRRIQANTSGNEYLSNGSYSISTDGEEFSLSEGIETHTYNSIISDQYLEFDRVEEGSLVHFRLIKINEDLCQGINCNNGNCFQGYCICDDGYVGDACTELQGSVGSANALQIFDKGSYSDGWRYIEVSKSPINTNGIPWGCKPKDLSAVVGEARNNVITMFSTCNAQSAIVSTAQITLHDRTDWLLPTSQELEIICTMKSQLDFWPNTPTLIWSSTANSPSTLIELAFGIMSHLCPSEEYLTSTNGLIYPVRYY